jgi:hypothetical protein
MGHTIADFNADGLLDLFVTGMPSPTVDRLEHLRLWRTNSPMDRDLRARMTYGNHLFISSTLGKYAHTSASDDVARTGWSWGCGSLDFDNDGFPDLYVANGMETRESVRDYEGEFWLHDIHVASSEENPAVDAYLRGKASRLRGRGTSYGGYENNRFFLNREGNSFVEVAFLLGLNLELDSRSVVSTDLDGDGKVDLLVTCFGPWPRSQPTLRIYHNVLQNSGHWIGFQFPEASDHVSPIGARVQIQAGDLRSVGGLTTGGSHHCQGPNSLHFGLGKIDLVERVVITGPDGQKITLNSPAIDRYHSIQLPKKIHPH